MWDKNDPLFVPGLVGPDEYNIQEDATCLAKQFYREPFIEITTDVQKYLGLVREYLRLRAINDKLQKENQRLWKIITKPMSTKAYKEKLQEEQKRSARKRPNWKSPK